jgi:hypothetical protein
MCWVEVSCAAGVLGSRSVAHVRLVPGDAGDEHTLPLAAARTLVEWITWPTAGLGEAVRVGAREPDRDRGESLWDAAVNASVPLLSGTSESAGWSIRSLFWVCSAAVRDLFVGASEYQGRPHVGGGSLSVCHPFSPIRLVDWLSVLGSGSPLQQRSCPRRCAWLQS